MLCFLRYEDTYQTKSTLNEAVSQAVELKAYINSHRRNQETKDPARPLTDSVPSENSRGSDIDSRISNMDMTLKTMLHDLTEL